MSEQLETIKCVDWTINFPGGCWMGEQTGSEPMCRSGRPSDLFTPPSEVHLDSSGQVTNYPSLEGCRSVTNWP